jgi:hypothetical protein
MNYFNLLTSSIFIVYGFIGYSAASGTKPACVNTVETEMPLYTAVYNHDGTNTAALITELDVTLTGAKRDVNLFPYKRSALHRAIEILDHELVDWLITEGAAINYGLDPVSGELLPAKKRVGEPSHLVGHLEEYYRPGKDAEVINILDLLRVKGLDVGAWPVKDKAFFDFRSAWGTDRGLGPDTFAFHENSTMASEAAKTSSRTGSSGPP